MIILLHSSKTMRQPGLNGHRLRAPQLVDKARELGDYLKTLSPDQLVSCMHISAPLAAKTRQLLANWTTAESRQSLAIDSFVGDIYSGLRASELSTEDRDYADNVLRILSGLYGIIRPYDAIMPYRLEMGYKLPDAPYNDLYTFWGQAIADTLPLDGPIVNASSVEFSKTITPFVDAKRLITPNFLTIDSKTRQPTFKVVHAKIARGAFARWLITQRVADAKDLTGFDDLGYRYNARLSTPDKPAFVCQEFLGKGLSMRS